MLKKVKWFNLSPARLAWTASIYKDPRKFDIQRDHDKSISFGQGPHYCIGVTLVRSQTEVMLKELFKRFPNLSLGSDNVVYDYNHHNARRMDVMTGRYQPW
jgi:cytochrome P450